MDRNTNAIYFGMDLEDGATIHGSRLSKVRYRRIAIYIYNSSCLSVSKKCLSPCNSKTERRMANLSTDSESARFN